MLNTISAGANHWMDQLLRVANAEASSIALTPLIGLRSSEARSRHLVSLARQMQNLDALLAIAHQLESKTAQLKAIHRQQRLLTSYACCAIYALPEELLRTIFSMVCLSNPFGSLAHLGMARTISHVCRQWRDVITKQSAIWAAVQLPSTAIRYAGELLTRSHPRGFRLTMISPRLATVGGLVSRHTLDRMIELRVFHPDSHDLLPSPQPSIRFSLLRYLTLHGQSDFADVIDCFAFPELHFLSLDRLTRFLCIEAPKLKELQVTLWIGMPFAWWLEEYLPRSRELESVQIRVCPDHCWVNNEFQIYPPLPIRLDRLQNLSLVDLPADGLSVLVEDIVAPDLRTICARGQDVRLRDYPETPAPWSEDSGTFRKLVRSQLYHSSILAWDRLETVWDQTPKPTSRSIQVRQARHIAEAKLLCAPPLALAILEALAEPTNTNEDLSSTDGLPHYPASLPSISSLTTLVLCPDDFWLWGEHSQALAVISNLISVRLVETKRLLKSDITIAQYAIWPNAWNEKNLLEAGCRIHEHSDSAQSDSS